MHFPAALTEEELMLQAKYAKLKKKVTTNHSSKLKNPLTSNSISEKGPTSFESSKTGTRQTDPNKTT